MDTCIKEKGVIEDDGYVILWGYFCLALDGEARNFITKVSGGVCVLVIARVWFQPQAENVANLGHWGSPLSHLQSAGGVWLVRWCETAVPGRCRCLTNNWQTDLSQNCASFLFSASSVFFSRFHKLLFYIGKCKWSMCVWILCELNSLFLVAHKRNNHSWPCEEWSGNTSSFIMDTTNGY